MNEDCDDEELARAAKEGSVAARDKLFFKHRMLVRQFGGPARRIVRTAEWAGRVGLPIEQADVDQQAFVIFCDLLAWWQPEREPFMVCLKRKLPWLLRHYVHVTLSGRSGDASRQTVPFEDALVQRPHGPCVSGEELADAAAWSNRLKTLPTSLRRTVTLRYYDDLSSAQIASISGRTQREINRKLRAALSILRDKMQEDWEDV